MKSTITEWLWRAAVLGGLVWIGWELHTMHADLMQPAEEATVATGPDSPQDNLDDIRDSLAGLTQKVDAILVVMARSK